MEFAKRTKLHLGEPRVLTRGYERSERKASRKVRKVREVINWRSLAAEASKKLIRRKATLTRWIAAVSAAFILTPTGVTFL